MRLWRFYLTFGNICGSTPSISILPLTILENRNTKMIAHGLRSPNGAMEPTASHCTIKHRISSTRDCSAIKGLLARKQSSYTTGEISGLSPEAYIAAVKACPRVAWIHKPRYSGVGKLLWRGYATRLEGDNIEIVPDFVLSSKSDVRSYASSSTPDKLRAWESNGIFFPVVPERHFLRRNTL